MDFHDARSDDGASVITVDTVMANNMLHESVIQHVDGTQDTVTSDTDTGCPDARQRRIDEWDATYPLDQPTPVDDHVLAIPERTVRGLSCSR